jgi:hypothetical protein
MQYAGFTQRSRRKLQAQRHCRPASNYGPGARRGPIAKLILTAMLLAALAPSRLPPIPDVPAQWNIGVAFSVTPKFRWLHY